MTWRRLFVLVSLRCLTGCGGAPFESTSFGPTPLAGAPSSAGAQAGASSGGRSGGAGGTSEIPDAPSGAAGELSEAGAAPTVPCDVSAWKALAFASSPTSTPALALDGDASTRWQSGEPRAKGQWFELDLGAGVVLQALELHTAAAFDMPQTAALELDGKRIAAAVTAGEGVIRFTFAAPAHIVRVVLVDGTATAWWSIDELGASCE